MKQFFLTLAGVFAGLLLFFVGVPIVLIASLVSSAKPAPAPANTVLSLDLRQPLSDQESGNPFAVFSAKPLSVMSVVQTLRRAKHDDHVKGLLIRLPEGGVAPAAADEIRIAIRDFRTSGKPVIAHSQGIYPSGASAAAYMLGAASGAFWMQPGASLQAPGYAREEMFFKRAFDKYGVTADYQQRYQYKNAVNPYLYDDYTPAHREAELGWMTSVYEVELISAAYDRKADPASLKTALEGGPFIAEDALAKHLIDKVGQVEEAVASLKTAAGEGAVLTDFGKYRASNGGTARSTGSGPTVAVISAEGEIETGTSGSEGFGSSTKIYSDDLAKAFYDAARDDDVKAIVFRVSSPGGSDTASEQILAGVRAAKAAGKPVVVSMGTYAASGGYWISSEASEIVAEPTTLTGSIGVFGGKFVLGPALARFGIDTRGLSIGGPYAAAFNSAQPFTAQQRGAFAAWMDRIYENFVARVASGRHLSPDRVREIAKGRVWTGIQARQLGLVDKVGGFYDAVGEARSLAKIKADTSITLRAYPGHKSAFETLTKAFGASEASIRAVAGLGVLLGDPRSRELINALLHVRAGVQDSTVLSPTSVQ